MNSDRLTPTPRPTSDEASNLNSDIPMPHSPITIHDVEEDNVEVEQSQTNKGGHPPKSNKRNGPKSMAWNHFTKVADCDPENPKATCNYCRHMSNIHPKRNGTSSMLAHLKGCVKYRSVKSRLDNSQSKLSFDVSSAEENISGNLTMTKYNAEKIKIAICKMVIIDELPFRVVEGKGFRELIKTIEPRYVIPSRTTVMRECVKIYLHEKDFLKSLLLTTKQRISFTTDTWTSIQNFNYMCITAHFIDSDWNMHKRIISFSRIEDHKGITIGKHLEDCMVQWGIDRILSITVDNASSNDSAIEWLKRRPMELKEVISGHKFLHMRCCAHILNLIVSEGLTEVDDSIVRVRNLIKYVKSSPQRLEQFKVVVSKRKVQCSSLLTLDVSTRWNSTYLMLEVAEKYESAFHLMQLDDESVCNYLMEDRNGRKGLGPPTCEDWDIIRIYIKFLKMFYEATLRMSGTLYITSNLFFHQVAFIYKHLISFCESEDALLSGMAHRMKAKYDKYWGNLEKVNGLLFVAAFLDPRVKLRVLEVWFKRTIGEEKGEAFALNLRKDIDMLFEQYTIISGHSSGCQSSGHDIENQNCTNTKSEDVLMDFLQECHDMFSSVDEMESKSEVERYLLEPPEVLKATFDILTWWKVNSSKYPVLSLIARDVLAIPITSVASESAFSTGGRVLDPFRSALAPKTVEALICTQDWLKSSTISLGQYDIVDKIDEDESEKLDAEMMSDLTTILDEK